MTCNILDLSSMVYADGKTNLVIEATGSYLSAYRVLPDGTLTLWTDDSVRRVEDIEDLRSLPLADLEDLAAEFAIELTVTP